MMKLLAATGDDDDLRCQPDTDLQTREWIGGARSEGPCLLLEVNTGMGSQDMTLGALIFDCPAMLGSRIVWCVRAHKRSRTEYPVGLMFALSPFGRSRTTGIEWANHEALSR